MQDLFSTSEKKTVQLGDKSERNSLVKRIVCDNVINAGSFDFEGSIVCSVLMVLMTAGIFVYYEQKKHFKLVNKS